MNRVSAPSVKKSAARGTLIIADPNSLTTTAPVSAPLSRSDSEIPDNVYLTSEIESLLKFETSKWTILPSSY